MSGPLTFRDRRVQIAAAAVGVIALLAVLAMFLLQSNPSPTPAGTDVAGSVPVGGPGMPAPGGGPMTGGVPAGTAGPMTGGPPAGTGGAPVMGATGAAVGATGGARAATATKAAAAAPPHRRDPFEHTTPQGAELTRAQYEVQTQAPVFSDQLRGYGVQSPQLYQQLRAERQQEKANEYARRGIYADTGDPPMRMAGVMVGNRLQGILEIAGESRVVRPGEPIGPYRVERVEPAKIVLSKAIPGGRRRLDVPLQDNPALAQQYPMAAPGGGGGSGGPAGGSMGPGGFSGGPPGGSGGRMQGGG